MREGETELAMVQRHVLQGAGLVARQMELVYRLRDRGFSTEEAETLLLSFQGVQRLHQEHLARLELKT